MTMTCAAVYGDGVLDDVGQDFLDEAVNGELQLWGRPAVSPSVYGVSSGFSPSSRMTVPAAYFSLRPLLSVLRPPVVGKTAYRSFANALITFPTLLMKGWQRIRHRIGHGGRALKAWSAQMRRVVSAR